MIALFALAALAAVVPQAANPVIAGHGAIHPVPDAANRPDPAVDYKVVFSVTTSNPAGKANPGLEKVARLINLLGDGGVPAGHRHIVPIVHGGATPLVLNAKAYAARFHGAANPDADLIAKLKAAGAPVHVCAQALAGFGIAADQVDSDVIVDDSALTTMATLQLKGYALIAD
jgi:intracellular sulfur oxidation DsrE/DsrF family protein